MLQLKPVMSCHIVHGQKERIISLLSAATIYLFEGCYHTSPPGISSLVRTTLISFHPVFSFQSLGLWSLLLFSCRFCSAVPYIFSGACTADIVLQFRLGWNLRIKKTKQRHRQLEHSGGGRNEAEGLQCSGVKHNLSVMSVLPCWLWISLPELCW